MREAQEVAVRCGTRVSLFVRLAARGERPHLP
jgi:hypothetical protein